MKSKPNIWRSIAGALLIGAAVHGLLAVLDSEPLTRYGIGYKLRWVTLPVEIFPIWLAISMSGNVHQPSELAAWLGILLQWIAVGVLHYFYRVLRDRHRAKQEAKASSD